MSKCRKNPFFICRAGLAGIFLFLVLIIGLTACGNVTALKGEYWYDNSRLELLRDGRFTHTWNGEQMEGVYYFRNKRLVLVHSNYDGTAIEDTFLVGDEELISADGHYTTSDGSNAIFMKKK